MLKAVMFGAGGGGLRLYDFVKERYEIVAIVDNDKRKWGTQFYSFYIEEPQKCFNAREYDIVVLTSVPGKDSIIEQLRGYGIKEKNIDTSLVDYPLESRRIFLLNLSKLINEKIPNEVSVAEAGVFQGDFAQYINQYFPNRKLFLFDTWKGFDSRDISIEKHRKFSSADVSDYDNTNVELVLKK